MVRVPVFLTGRLPVLYSIHAIDGGRTSNVAALDVAVVVKGAPSILGICRMALDRLDEVVASLQGGDVRVAVAALPEDTRPPDKGPRAFVSLVCADGRRLPIARVRGRDHEEATEQYARRLARAIASGTKLADVADSDST
ncbi:MAG: hypothetical protein R3E10_05885 [Gemmatimonadota bacterium]